MLFFILGKHEYAKEIPVMSENAERNLRLFQELLTCARTMSISGHMTPHLANTNTNCPDAAILNSFSGNIEQTRLLLPPWRNEPSGGA